MSNLKENEFFIKRWASLIVLSIISGLVYFQALDFDFVWDDRKNIVENPFLNPPSLQTILFFWKNQFLGMYVPVPYTFWGSIEILRTLFSSEDMNAFVFHLSNIAIHTLNGFLVYLLLSKIIKNNFATIFFIVHPIQTETVSWISETRGLLATFFGLSAVIFYLQSVSLNHETQYKRFLSFKYIGGFLCFIFALLSKPSSAVIPLFAIVLESYIYKTKIKFSFFRIAPWFLPILFVVLITSSVQGNTQLYSFWVKPFIYLSSISFYLFNENQTSP